MPEMLMPKLSDTMEEGTILRWIKADGDQVAKGEPLVEIETDKATMTVEAPGDGVLSIIAEEGDTLDVGAPIARLGDGATAHPAAADAPDNVATGIPTADDGTARTISAAATPAVAPASPAAPAPAAPAVPVAVTPPSGDRSAASPLARNIAAHAGLDLSTVTGTGPGGRIVKHDVEAALGAAGGTADAPVSAPMPEVPLGSAIAPQPVPPKMPPPVPRGDWQIGRARVGKECASMCRARGAGDQ